MKKILIIGLLTLTGWLANAQDGLRVGAEISPAWNINMQRSNSTGILTNTNGYGFNIGVPVRWGFSESLSLQTGLTFELMMFDVRINNTLESSTRHGSINVPLFLSYQLSGGWYLNGGVGVNYNLMNTYWTQINKISITSTTNVFQPYAGLGISTFMERGIGDFELGAQGRFHFLDMYEDSDTNWIVSLDLVLRYYLFSTGD